MYHLITEQRKHILTARVFVSGLQARKRIEQIQDECDRIVHLLLDDWASVIDYLKFYGFRRIDDTLVFYIDLKDRARNFKLLQGGKSDD